MTEKQFKELIEDNKASIDKACVMYADSRDYLDLRQEIYCALWVALKKNPNFENEKALRSWVFSVALRVGKMYMRNEY